MSFLKITDPKKREAMIRDYIETRKRIKDNLIAEKVGKMETQTELSKLFKPITETQKTTTKKITEGLKPIREGIENLPQAITFPAYPSIQASEKPLEGEDTQYIGGVAEKYLRKFATKGEADTTYGLYDRHGKFYIGNKPVVIIDNNIVVDDEEYEGTPGLWELIVSKEPDKIKYNKEDLENYAGLIVKTNALYQGNNPNNPRPKSSKGQKWNNILKPIWTAMKQDPGTTGDGLVVLSGDPNTLLERLDLLLESQKAGHTGVRNELVSICDELKRQGVINANEYKKLNSIIKK